MFKESIKLVPTNENKENELQISVGYDLGGFNYFTYGTNKRGYYLYVTPVEVEHKNGYNTVSQTLGKGVKQLLKEVTRKSNKAEAEAEALAKDNIDNLVAYVCDKYNLIIEG